MNNSLKVALGHLSHTTTGRHSVYMPINIGYIGAYARSVLGEENIELRLYSEADHMSQDITDWKPDVVATANYVWNSEIGLAILKIAREVNPDVVCVAGGPEIPELPEDRKAYLDDRPQIDLYAYIEGELPFGELVKKIYAGASAIELRREPQPGLIALHPDTGELLTGLPMDRPMDMDVIPSPYLTGLMDQWFDGSYAPSIETARGCPFRCTFCFQGQKYFNTIARFSVERINAEFTYMAERMKDYPDILLNICDSNFGMYKRDLEFADHLRGLQDTHGWPNAFNVTTGKANYDRILEVAEKLRNKMHDQNPREVVETNVMGTLNVLSAAHRADVERFVHTSTSEVYGSAVTVPIDERHPLQGQSPYSASKIGADKIVESYYASFGLPVTTIRPFNIYGPRQSARAVIPTIIGQALSGSEIRLGSLTPTRDFTFVEDTVDGFVKIVEADDAIGGTFNVGSNFEISIGDLAKEIVALTGSDADIVQDETRVRPEKSEVRRLLADNTLAGRTFGWRPTVSLRDGLKRTMDWIGANPGRYDFRAYTT